MARVHLGTIEEKHQVGVLLDGSRIPQIRQHWTAVTTPLFRRSRQLGESHQRDAQLSRKGLQRSGDEADFGLATLRFGGALHQLQIIHHQKADVVLRLHPSGFRPQFQEGNCRRVVDPDLGTAEAAGRPREAREVLVAELAGPEALKIHEALGCQETLDELLPRHLEGEDRHGHLTVDCRVGGNVEAERGLSHRRARRHDDEIAGLKAVGHRVQICEPAGDSLYRFIASMARFYALHRVPHEFLDPDEFLRPALEGNFEDLVLGQVQQLAYVFLAVVRCLDDSCPDVDEPSHQRLVFDDPCVELYVGRRRYHIQQD